MRTGRTGCCNCSTSTSRRSPGERDVDPPHPRVLGNEASARSGEWKLGGGQD
jgi:hypothetical protein